WGDGISAVIRLAKNICRSLIRLTRCLTTVISPWVITVITATTAAIGDRFPRRIWWAEDCLFTGRFTRIGDLFVRPMTECWSDVLTCITSIPIIADVGQTIPGVYGWLCLFAGYVLVMLFAPVRRALVDGLHCLGRYQRIWITFAVLGFSYFVFQFVTFTPIRTWSDLELSQITSLPQWVWPRLNEIWTETLLPALEGVAGIFDNATTTYPLSVIAAILMIANWR